MMQARRHEVSLAAGERPTRVATQGRCARGGAGGAQRTQERMYLRSSDKAGLESLCKKNQGE